jgi:hypothetical protein
MKKPARQIGQTPNAVSVMTERLTDRSQLRWMKNAARQIAETQPGGYRCKALQRTGRGFGWWQHVGAGVFDKIKPTLHDYNSLRLVFDTLKDAEQFDADLYDALLEVLDARAMLDIKLAALLAKVRRKAKKR